MNIKRPFLAVLTAAFSFAVAHAQIVVNGPQSPNPNSSTTNFLHLKIGGPALCENNDWADNFLKYMSEHKVELK